MKNKEIEEAKNYFKKRIDICMKNADICDDNNFDEEATYLRKEQILTENILQYIEQLENKVKELECDKHNKENKIIEQEKFLQMSAEVIKNSLLKQVIRDKIEEINKEIEKYREYTEQGIETDIEWVDNVANRQIVEVLRELLEEK